MIISDGRRNLYRALEQEPGVGLGRRVHWGGLVPSGQAIPIGEHCLPILRANLALISGLNTISRPSLSTASTRQRVSEII